MAMKLVGGGILALIALAVAKILAGMVFGLFAFVIAIAFKIALIALVVWLVVRFVRYMSKKPAFEGDTV
jgi:uncharacterized membrane protein YjgN (DUF898 family)